MTKLFKLKINKLDPLNAGFIENDVDDEEGEYDSEKTRNLNENIFEFNSQLAGFGLESFQYRLFKKCMNFGFGIYHDEYAPPILKSKINIEVPKEPEILKNSNDTERTIRLIERKKRAEINTSVEKNLFDKQTFSYFFTKLCSYYYSDFKLNNINLFQKSLKNDIFIKLNNFSFMFKKFNLPYSAFRIKRAKKRELEKKKKKKIFLNHKTQVV